MVYRRVPFAIDEWYHCYSRGVDKRITFEERSDYERFVQLLYLSNTSAPVHRSNLTAASTVDVLAIPLSDSLVSIGAYCLMPNHFHLLIKEVRDDGITTFMRKLGTAYAMYFNTKNDRAGNLFVKPFRSQHVDSDAYLQHCVRYIHMNPIELKESRWKDGEVRNISSVQKFLESYRYSSLVDHHGVAERPERKILGGDGFEAFERAPMEAMLEDAQGYYRARFAALQ